MFGNKEYYPFAPYTMYSYKHDITKMQFYELNCLNKKFENKLTPEMIVPLDFARLVTSLDESYRQRSFKSVEKKLASLVKIVTKNSFDCEKILFKVIKYRDGKTFLEKEGSVIDILEGHL
jgi:hypothetical protein